MRDLKENEIECKIAQINEKGLTLLLYKTARTDAQMLDETEGEMKWQCEYEEGKGNMYCTIKVWDKEKNQWIGKQDCGVESAFGDKEKGEASDAFKRAGFKWGIGVELYTSPFIYISADKCTIKKTIKNQKETYVCNDKFKVEKIKTENKRIEGLSIINENTNNRVFLYNNN